MKLVNDEEIMNVAFRLIRDALATSEDIAAALYSINGVVTLADELLKEDEK